MTTIPQAANELAARDVLTDACVRRAAVESAERGLFVFPTRPDGKEPRCGLSWPHAATADLARLALARWRPGENYGFAAKLSGLVIVDLDRPKPGYELSQKWRLLGWHDEPGIRDGWDVLAALAERIGATWPHTFTVTTPSGGAHLYYVAPAGRSIGNRPLGPMIDIRGGGGVQRRLRARPRLGARWWPGSTRSPTSRTRSRCPAGSPTCSTRHGRKTARFTTVKTAKFTTVIAWRPGSMALSRPCSMPSRGNGTTSCTGQRAGPRRWSLLASSRTARYTTVSAGPLPAPGSMTARRGAPSRPRSATHSGEAHDPIRKARAGGGDPP